MLGVVKLDPVNNAVPPVNAVYQLTLPALAVAPSVTVPVPQFEPGVTVLIVGILFMLATTKVLESDVQPLAIAST